MFSIIGIIRSPSPPPTYDAQGRRTNTRDIRYRRKLENERISLVERAMKNDPNFQAPAEYHQQKRSHRPQDKVYIPVKEFPEINFFGLLVGPRGNSLKKMERESGAKISIRGKGSVKEGKGRPDAFADDAEEDLHCLIMADTQDKVASCVALINRVIETVSNALVRSADRLLTKSPYLFICRLPRHLKVKTITNGTNSVNSPHSTALSETMRIKYVKTAVTVAIASTTVPSNATTPPTSSAVSVVQQDIWRATAHQREIPMDFRAVRVAHTQG